MTIDVPGREGDLARLTAAYERVVRTGTGQALYVNGAPGSGRTTLLRSFAGELARREDPPTLLTGAFENGRFVSWDDTGPPPQRVTAVVEKVVWLPEALVPYAALVGLAMSRGPATIELVRELFAQNDRIAPTAFLPRLMDTLCDEAPVVLLVDDADRAPGGLWGDAVLELGKRVARDHPLLFVLAIERPAQLDQHEDDEPESLYLARRLRGRARARWVTLDLVTIDALGEWTGPAAPDVIERLYAATGGRAAWAADLWRHWRSAGIVVPTEGEDDDRGRWTFAAGERERTLDGFDDVLGRRLAELAGEDVAAVRELLAHAALEGPVFTADAVARALRRDRDEVIDLLDDMLLHDEAHPEGVVHEAGSIDVTDERGAARHLWLYRFHATLDWLTLAYHGLDESRRRAAARALAQALVDVYGGPHYVAETLARLYELAGDEEPARRHRRLADAGADRTVLLWRAEELLARTAPQERPDRNRAAAVLLAAARSLSRDGPFEDGRRFALAVYRLAPLREDRAEAQYLAGVHGFKLGEYDAARHALNLALALYRELADDKGQADVRAALALIDSRRGAHEAARSELAFVLEVYRALGDRDAQGATRQSLANIDIALGEIDRARDSLVALLALQQEDGDGRGEAGTRLRIARLDMEQGRFEDTRSQLGAALEIYRQLGDRHGEADTRHNLARLGIELGALDDARREFMRVLAVYRELGDLVGQAATRHSLASIAMEQRVYEKARRELTHVLELGRQMEDDDVVQTALDDLKVVNTVDPPSLDD